MFSILGLVINFYYCYFLLGGTEKVIKHTFVEVPEKFPEIEKLIEKFHSFWQDLYRI